MANVQLDLNDSERRLLVAALSTYQKIKGAEKMLRYHGQLKNDRAGAERTRAKYDALLTLTGQLLAQVTVES